MSFILFDGRETKHILYLADDGATRWYLLLMRAVPQNCTVVLHLVGCSVHLHLNAVALLGDGFTTTESCVRQIATRESWFASACITKWHVSLLVVKGLRNGSPGCVSREEGALRCSSETQAPP